MKSAHLRIAFPAAAILGLVAAPAVAQRPIPPEQRIAILEQQLAASQTSAIRLEQRINLLEQQLQQLINQGEVNGHRVSVLESDLGSLRTDISNRLSAIESRPATSVAAADSTPDEGSAPPKPKKQTAAVSEQVEPVKAVVTTTDSEPSDPGEDAYSKGFHLWQDGKYDQAITALRAFTAGFPNHRRVSFANNLAGRALLDKGEPRAAAEVLLSNYRSNPKGERASDSLYYLGQALMQLNQPQQACKAYAELEDVYGSSVRDDLKSLVAKGKADAHCS